MLPLCGGEGERNYTPTPRLPKFRALLELSLEIKDKGNLHTTQNSDSIRHSDTFRGPETPYPHWRPLLLITLAWELPQEVP